jgi:hypothetical protein
MQKLNVPASLKAHLKSMDLIEWLIPFFAEKYHLSHGQIMGVLAKPDEELAICLDRWRDDDCQPVNRTLLTQWWTNIYPGICIWNKQRKQKFQCYNHPQQLFELTQDEFKQLLSLYWLERRLKGISFSKQKSNKDIQHSENTSNKGLIAWAVGIYQSAKKSLFHA